MTSILHCPGDSLWCPQSHKTAREGSALSRPSSGGGGVPCSVKKWGPSDFSAHKTSEAGFLPKVNPREIGEARGKHELQELLKSGKTPEVTEDYFKLMYMEGRWLEGAVRQRACSTLTLSLRCPETVLACPSPTSQQQQSRSLPSTGHCDKLIKK